VTKNPLRIIRWDKVQWKIYSWIYLVMLLYVILLEWLHPIKIETELTPIQYSIVYVLASLFWLIPALGLFLYSYNKRKLMIFWKLYFVYFAYGVIVMFIEAYKAGAMPLLLPFNAITLVGLFLYSFTRPKVNGAKRSPE